MAYHIIINKKIVSKTNYINYEGKRLKKHLNFVLQKDVVQYHRACAHSQWTMSYFCCAFVHLVM